MLRPPKSPQGGLLFIALTFSVLISTCLYAANNPFLRAKQYGQTVSSSEGNDARAVMIVLDCSGSMSDSARSGRTKMYAAKRVLERTLSKIDPNVYIGLRVYGTAKPSMDMYERCRDTRLAVAPGTNNRETIINALREIKPSGATPISLAMKRSIEDMAKLPVKKKSVVLISDGMDTCGYDPCTLAMNLQDNGVDIQFNVIGFGLGEDLRAINQLECISAVTEGKFYSANDSDQLADSLLDGINRYGKVVTGKITEVKE